MTSIHFRDAKISDVLQLAEIHIASAKSAYKEFIPKKFLDEIYNLSSKVKLWEEVVTAGLGAVIVALNDKKKIVGFACFQMPGSPNKNMSIELYTIYITPDYLRQGVGSALIQEMLKKLKPCGSMDVFLWVLDKNIEAKKFYRKWGFNETAEKRVCDDLPETNLFEVKLILLQSISKKP